MEGSSVTESGCSPLAGLSLLGGRQDASACKSPTALPSLACSCKNDWAKREGLKWIGVPLAWRSRNRPDLKRRRKDKRLLVSLMAD
jgi:hypothetical protein